MIRDERPGTEPRGGADDRPIVMIGVGNVLLGDDAIGVRVVEALGRMVRDDPGALPHGTRVLDGGTLGLDLLRELEGARALIVVDAVDLGHAPGTVSVLRDGEPSAIAGSCAPGVGELIATARLLAILPPDVVLVGIQAGEIKVGRELSGDVAAALPAAAAAVRREAQALARSSPSSSPSSSRATELAGAVS